MSDIVLDLERSAAHSQSCGWITHAQLDRRAVAEIKRLKADNVILRATLIELRNTAASALDAIEAAGGGKRRDAEA